MLDLIGDRLQPKLNPSSLLVAQLVLVSGPDGASPLRLIALTKQLVGRWLAAPSVGPCASFAASSARRRLAD